MIQRINKKHEKTTSRKKSGFVYKERDPATVKKRAEQDGGRFDSIFKQGFDTYRPKVGSNVIRYLPPTWDGHDHYGLDVYVHGFIGPNRGSYLCLQKMKNKPCPLCDLEAELRKGGETEDANKVAARKKVLTWIIDRDGDETTPMLYMMGWTIDRDVSDLARNKRTGETLLIDHPDEGYDVSFTRKGNNLNTDYFGWQIDRASSPVADKQKDQDAILEYITENPLPDVLKFASTEKLQQAVDGVGEEPDEDDADDEDRKPTKKKARAKDDDEDSEDEGERVRPSSKKRPRKSADDDEDSDDDDESEDERPSGKRARPRRSEPDDDEDTDDADDEQPSKPAKKGSSRRRDDDEEEDEAEDDVEETEEEEDTDEAPSKRGKPRRRPAREAEEDEDEPEEVTEEEEEPPKRVRTRKPAPKDEDEDEEDERPTKKKSRPSDEDEDTEEDEEPPRRGKVKPKARRRDEDEEDDE